MGVNLPVYIRLKWDDWINQPSLRDCR